MESTSSVTSEDIMKSKQAVIMEFAEVHSAELAAERFGVPRNTVRSWLKQQKIPTRPVYNSPGQGRKITYSRELDAQIAEYTRALLSKQERVTVQDVCTYARKLIQQENPEFTASTGWAQRFLARNNIDLSAQVRKLIPTTRQANSSSSSSPDNRGRPLSYSADTDNLIAEWVKGRTDNGDVVTNSELRKYAKELVIKENSNFTGSASWAQNFLLRHRLSLQPSYLNVVHEKYKSTDPMHSVPDSHSVQNLHLMSSHIVCESNLVTDSRNITVSAPLQLVSQNLTTVNNGSLTTSGGTFTGVDDSVTSTLALLAGENLPVEGNLTQAQATALALSDLTSDPALAEILGTAHDPSASNITAFTQAGLDSSASQLSYLSSLGQHLSDLVVPTVGGAHHHGFVGGVVSQAHNTLQSMINHPDMEVIGSGTRPLSYTKETDQALANWVKDQQLAGHKVTFASLRAYAKKLVSSENPNFNASVGWVTPFLLRHNLDLKVNDKRNRSTRKTTHPRKLLSKENPDEDTNLDTPMDEAGELDIQRLSVIPQLATEFSEHTHPPTSMESSVQLVTEPGDIANETRDKPTIDEFLPPSKRLRVGNRSRHTLAEKLEVVRLMKQFNVAGHYVSRMLGIANSTLSGWIKLVDQKGAELEALSTNRKRSNRTGQGRPLTYSREKDEVIAHWVRQQQEMDVPVTAYDLTTYATTVIGEDNRNFVASVGWRHKFLQRHNLQLVKGDKSAPAEDIQNIPLPVQTEEVCTDEYTPDIIEKVYPDEIDTQLADWVKDEVLKAGNLSIQNFCKKAEEMIMSVDPMFVATLGWAFKFLHRHNLLLDPKPVNIEICRKRSSSSLNTNTVPESQSPKKQNSASAALMAAAIGISPEGLTISPSTGNLCEALLSLSSQPEQLVMNNIRTMQTSPNTDSMSPSPLSSKNYFGKPAREFSGEEKEEVVRYANATTLQKAAIKYGIAAPTIWRWRMELKLHQPKYTANQKKYIVKFAESNSLKDAAQRFGITTKTIQNWKRALQMDGTLSDVEIAAIPPPSIQELTGEIDSEKLTTPTSASGGLITEEVIPLDNSHFQYVVDGGEVAEGSRVQSQVSNPNLPDTSSSSLEVTHEIQVQDVGMEYDVISSEGHAAKPRCTPEEKTHILQYALEHSIKEASVKFGVSPGTLYYWKKNHLAGQKSNQNNITGTKSKSPIYEGSFPSAPPTSLETTIVNVPIPVDIMGNTNIIQSPGGGLDSLQTLTSITDASMLTDTQGTVPTSNLINAITQTLASATPEQLQSLQQITSDLNLLQAVTSLINSQEGSTLRQVITSDSTLRRDSTGGGISSPTDVLVSFHPIETPTSNIVTPTHQTDLQVQLQVSSDLPITIEEVTTSSNTVTPTEVTMETGNEDVTTTEKPNTTNMEQPEA